MLIGGKTKSRLIINRNKTEEKELAKSKEMFRKKKSYNY